MTWIRLAQFAQLLLSIPAALGAHAPRSPRLPGKSVGRRFTVDNLPNTKAMQVDAWLKRSCLEPKDLPGEILKNERTIFFFDIDGEKIVRPEEFRRLFSGSEVEPKNKYLSPAKEPPRLYFPQNRKRFDWRAHAADPKQRKIFVEGPAKAACATKFGFPAVGIQGCTGWSARKYGRFLLADFDDYEFEACDVYVVFDHDRKPKSVADVARASNALALFLTEKGARVHPVSLPLFEGFSKVGADDYFYHYSRGGKDIAAAVKAFEDLLQTTPIWQDYELTEPGNAKRWVELHGSVFRFVGKKWLVYRKGCWRHDDLGEVQETAKQMFEDLLDDARHSGDSTRFSVLNKHATTQRIKNVAELAKTAFPIAARQEDFDQQDLWLNCPNGVLELPSKPGAKPLLREHRPEDMLTKQIAVPYSPDAPCPEFRKALDFWTRGNRDLQRTIQQLLGVSLTGDTSQQAFIILYGPGQTGKSTLMEIVLSIVGDYGKTISSDTLLIKRNGSPEERKLASLPGVRFATCSETATGEKIDENLIKLLTGEDTVAARRLYEEQFDFKPKAKFWVRTNNKPAIAGTDNAIWRRVIIVPFGHIVPESQKDPQLKTKLRKELAGILAWMVEGYLDFVTTGHLYKAPSVLAEIEQYRKEQNVMERFFEEVCEFGPDYIARKEELYFAYKQWSDGQRRRPLTNEEFKKEINEHFGDRVLEKPRKFGKIGHRVWVGVRRKIAPFEPPA